MFSSAEKKLWKAADDGKVEDLRKILKKDADVDINWRSPKEAGNQTALLLACDKGHDAIIPLLLMHPDVDVNQKDREGATPFLGACVKGRTRCLQVLLQDMRVLVNEPGHGYTPLWCVASSGNLEIIRLWIASGREMDLGQPGNPMTDAVAKAHREGRREVVDLLQRFKENPHLVRSDVLKGFELGQSLPFYNGVFNGFSIG